MRGNICQIVILCDKTCLIVLVGHTIVHKKSLTTANGFSSEPNHRSLSGVDSTRRPSNPSRSTTFENKVWAWTWHRTSCNTNLSDCGIRSNFDCFVARASQGGIVHPQETSRPEGGQASNKLASSHVEQRMGKLTLAQDGLLPQSTEGRRAGLATAPWGTPPPQAPHWKSWFFFVSGC